MTLSLTAPVVVEILRGERAHYRRFLEAAFEAGEDVRLCSLVLQQLAHAALNSEAAEVHLDQLAAFVGYVDTEPFTGEDAMVAARLQAEWERTVFASARSGMGLQDVSAAAQAQNRRWTLVVAQPVYAFGAGPILLWDDPAGPIDLRERMARLVRTGEPEPR